MSVKEFLKEWKTKKVKEMDKDDRTLLLYENIPTIVEFYIKKGHKEQELVNKLFDRMEAKVFAKTLLRILKTVDETPVDLGMATVIADFLEKRGKNLEEDLNELYTKAIDKILKTRIKKLHKKLGLDKDLLKELLVVVADKDAISDDRYVGIYVQRMTRKLYAIAKENELGLNDTKTIKKLFKSLFHKELLNSIAVNILLERKDMVRSFNENQLAIWNALTNFALDTIEKNKKKEIKELIEYYVVRRAKDAEKGRDSARRIQFAQISEEEYPKIYTVYEKLSEKEKYSRFL